MREMSRSLSRRIRVQPSAGQAVLHAERHRSRPSPMWDEVPPVFPDWFVRKDIDRHFEIVDGKPDVFITTLNYHVDPSKLQRMRPDVVPMVVIYSLDDFNEPASGGWGRSEAWGAAIRDIALSADLLVGPQLPVDIPHPNCLPLSYGPLVKPSMAGRPARNRRSDVYFSGAWKPSHGSRPSNCRAREFRGHLLEMLTRALNDRVLDIGEVHYWRTNPLQPGQPSHSPDLKDQLLSQHALRLADARLALAPCGYSYYTARHSDAFALGTPLLSQRVHRYVQVAEPDRWESGDLAFFYDPDEDDIANVAQAALADERGLDAMAKQGVRYAREHLAPASQAQKLSLAVRGL